MKVLLLNPVFPQTYWGFQHTLRIVGKKAIFPPLGLITVAALLPGDWEKRLVDLNAGYDLTYTDIQWADMVFITGMLIQKKALHELVKICKSHGKLVVVGGPYVSTSMEEVPEADHIFVGEAETTLPEFVRDLSLGTTKRYYKAPVLPDVTSSPMPDFDLLDLADYNTMSVQYSRGCPFLCEFCDITTIYGRVPRTKTNEQLQHELEALYALGWRGSVFLVDDNFIGNVKNVRLLMPDLVRWQEEKGFPFSFYTEASVNLADHPELLSHMRSAGFSKVFLGIETPVEASLKETKKTQNTKRSLLDAVGVIQSYGLEVMAGFIVGFDNDPPDIFTRQMDFIRESAIPLAMVGTLSALPDTPLSKRLKLEGRLLSESDGDNTGEGEINFIPKNMAASQIKEGHRLILRTIYSSRAYYTRVLDCLKRLPAPVRPEMTEMGLRQRLAILGRIVLRLGVLERERLEFWRFAFRAVTSHRNRFAQAMRLAIAGYHLRVLAYK